ncbi:MAG TPA: hypothetical protein VEY95_09255 [Azospirillaceae bacterium]|nr:hypothetical protein [Azospirillaceae bacterium]
MSRRRNAFEVQVYSKDHWVIDSAQDDEAAAVTYARAQVTQGRAEGVRVLKQWHRADGAVVETEVFTEWRPRSNHITIQTVEEAHRCESLGEYYEVDARLTMGRVLRKYLEHTVVTPTELLHNYSELKRFRDKDNLMASALGHVAQVQAGPEAGRRREEMFHVLERVTERARLASKRELPAVRSTGFGHLHRELAAKVADEEADYLALVALSRELVCHRNWSQKLGVLLGILAGENGIDAGSASLVDGVTADVLGSASVVQEILGPQPNLAAAILALADLADGRLDTSKRNADDFAITLNSLFAAGRLPQTRRVALDWVRRQLKGGQPLNRTEPARELDTFRGLVQRLVGPGGVVGGGAVAEGLTLRRLAFQEEGGTVGRQKAITGLVEMLPDGGNRLRYLLALPDSNLGRQFGDFIRTRIDGLFGNPDLFFAVHRPARENLDRIAVLWREVSTGAPSDDAVAAADRLDEMLVQYIEQNRIVERLDDPQASLRVRAVRLVQLCASGAVPSPKALAIARKRIVGLLRQPNFDREFVADIPDPAARDQALKDFYDLLFAAGFR